MADDFHTGSVRANGLEFHYLESGEGPLVLCLHGFPDNARTFRHQLPALAAAGYRAVAPYMRGYHPTEIPADARYQAAVLALDVLALIEALGHESAALIGHDWGAAAALGAASIAPEKLSKLILISVPHVVPLFGALATNAAQQRRSWYMFFFQWPSADEAVAANDFAFLERLWQDWSPGWRCPPEEMQAVKATFREPGVLQAALGYYRHLFNPGLHDPALASVQMEVFVPPVTLPTLYFHGESDGCIGVELTEGMESLFARGFEKVIVRGAGHFVHQEKPDEVNRRILSFLGR